MFCFWKKPLFTSKIAIVLKQKSKTQNFGNDCVSFQTKTVFGCVHHRIFVHVKLRLGKKHNTKKFKRGKNLIYQCFFFFIFFHLLFSPTDGNRKTETISNERRTTAQFWRDNSSGKFQYTLEKAHLFTLLFLFFYFLHKKISFNIIMRR